MAPLKVLITGAGAPGIRGTLFSLKNNWDKRKILTIGVDMKEDAVGRYLCNKFYKIPPADSDNFIDAIYKIAQKEKIDIILPQVTAELFKLSENIPLFADIGTKIAISDAPTIRKANNKYTLLSIAKKLDLPFPEFYLVKNWSELEKAIDRLGYPNKPFVIKPPISSGMRGLRIIFHKIDRKKAFFSEKPDSSKITLRDLYSVLGEEFPELIVMEYLPGKEYSVDVLSSQEEEVIVAIPRERIYIRQGITFAGMTVKNEKIIESTKYIVKNIGLKYVNGLQFKDDENGIPKIIEANPRIQGTMVLSTIAGANIIYGAIKLLLGEELPQFKIKWGTKFLRYWGGLGIYGQELIEI